MVRIPLHNLISKIVGVDIAQIDSEAGLKKVIQDLRSAPDFEIKVKDNSQHNDV